MTWRKRLAAAGQFVVFAGLVPSALFPQDALMEEGKLFESMVFPNQRHGFGGKKRENASRRGVDFWLRNLLGR